MPFKDSEKRREYQRLNYHKRQTAERRAYERERRNRKRLEQYMALPEPLRTQKLESNARRRAYKMRWTAEKTDFTR